MHLFKFPIPVEPSESGLACPAVTVNPDNTKVAFARLDGQVWIYALDKLMATVPITAQKPDFTELSAPMSKVIPDEGRSEITAVRYGNLTDFLAVGCSNGEVYIQRDGKLELAVEGIKSSVSDLSWSAEDELLAIATLGAGILIYDVNNQEVISIINQDATSIKGIAFDCNMGKNLISLSDDRKALLFEYTLTEDKDGKRHFNSSVKSFDGLVNISTLNKSRVRKLSWSRDNRIVTFPNASKGPQTALVTVMRNPENPPKQPTGASGSWKSWCSFVGHGYQCSVTSVSPVTYRNLDCSPQQLESAGLDIIVKHCPTALDYRYAYIVATGSLDSTIAIWSTCADSPLLVAEGISSSGVVDMSWSKDGSKLFFTTINGEFWVMAFEENELGPIVDSSTTGVIPASLLKKNLKEKLKLSREEAILEEKKASTQDDTAKSVDDTVETVVPQKTNGNAIVSTMVAKTKEGKKRVQPLLLSGSTNANGNSNGNDKNKADRASAPRPVSTMEFDPPSYSVGKELPGKVNKLARPADLDGDSSTNHKQQKKSIDAIEIIGSVVLNPSNAFSNVRISIPKVRSVIKQVSPTDDSLELEIINGNGNESTPSRVSLTKTYLPFQSSEVERKQVFVDFLPKRVLLATGGDGDFWVVATVDGNIIVYSDVGRRLLPPIVLGSPLSFLESKGKYLLAVTSIGELHIWDVPAKKSLFGSTSLFPLLQPIYRSNATDSSNNVYFTGEYLSRAENLTLCSVTATGIPVVTLSNGNGYLYNQHMGTWSLISDSWWAFGSQYWDSTAVGSTSNDKSADVDGGSENIVSLLERHTNEEVMRKGKGRLFSKISKIMLMKEGYENLEVVISLNHLENKLLVYELLGDEASFKNLFIVYMKRLSEIPLKARILEICAELYGPNDVTSAPWEPKVCGIDKHKLLKEIVLACAKYREVQRILVQYGEAVDVIG
ncbi:unnamed protein product [Kuraishia capsulata CBS 1993]|uniref:Protein HIR n=1 Tax=Kuraishia capsulata CBS 1993 TaxID=1382522 RepID=W6MI45_9ASCO|nr:uncharacterized protein KUCA_T00001498001 [Kuraishia capsulata CBS 1993]CDK25528.1 unnamed protein product [Kuraishia capsulata CBS 1993]